MPIPGRSKYETQTTETKQVEVCVTCSRAQELVENYITYEMQNSNKPGSEAGMLSYIQSKLLSVDSLNYTTAQIANVLTTCNTGWKKNIAFYGFNSMMGGGTPTRFRTENFSIELWIKPQVETSTIQYIANHFDGNIGYRLYIMDGQVYFQLREPVGGGQIHIRTSGKLDLNKWHHLAAVRHGNVASNYKIYVDGAAVATEIVDGMSALNNGDVYNEYSGKIAFGYVLNGLMKNIRVYNRPVTASEANANYHACNEAPTDTTGMQLWYKVDEGTDQYWVKDYGRHDLWASNPYQWSGGGLAMAQECLPDLKLLCNTVMQTVPKVKGYRYGFNGKENDNEPKGIEGSQQDYGFRIYDPRVGKFLSVDPLTSQYPWYTPYQFAGNKPVWATDLDGLEENISTSAFKFLFSSPRGYTHSRTALDNMSNERLKSQRAAHSASLLWAPHAAYYNSGGDALYNKHASWDKLGTSTTMKDKLPNNIVNVNATASAKEHGERVSNLNKQFHVNSNITGSETGLVNLLLGGFFKGSSPENIVFPTDGFGSTFLRNSPQVNEALSEFANKGQMLGKARAPSLTSSLSNIASGFKLQDFVGSIDYSINTKNGTLTLTMTNVTSLTSGTLGKEALGSSNWPSSILRGSQKGTNENSNYSQTFSLTFKIEEVIKNHKKKED
jgi:RHS repeat-associated protein